jgi:histidine triad (HIT) family protein
MAAREPVYAGHSKGCIFCDKLAGTRDLHVVWEDDRHLAFLTPFPNTAGATVVITKQHYPSYAFDLPDDILADLVVAAKIVAHLLDSAFEDVGRTSLVLEGFGVDHVHAKLYPLHGTAPMDEWRPIESGIDTFFERYEGYVASNDGPRADDKDLALLAERIKALPS